MQYVAVAVGAMLGANLRFLISTWVADQFVPGGQFPYGTLLINVTGAFALGIVLSFIGERIGINPLWRLFFATGFLGGYTTFSTYAWEVLSLGLDGDFLAALGYVLGSNVFGLAGVWLGYQLGRAVAT